MKKSLALLMMFCVAMVCVSRHSRAADPAPQALRIPVAFDVPQRGLVSLALYDQDGVLVRSLLYAQPTEAGSQMIQWDGTDGADASDWKTHRL